MARSAWRPKDEVEAASGLAAFVEWLRAGGVMPDAEPGHVLAWAAARGTAEGAGFDGAMAGFMGWRDGRPALGRIAGEAVVRIAGGVRRVGRYEVLPEDVAARLAGADAVGLAAFHVLARNTRPDDRVLWMGDPGDVLPLGALFVGAVVILADAPSLDLAAAEGASPLHG